MIRILFSFLLLFTFNTSYLYSGTIDPGISDHKYVEYGKDFQYIGKLCGKNKDGLMYCASGVAISKNHFLTAAHVVSDAVESKLTINGKELCVEKIVCHKDYQADKVGWNDIAIGFIKDDIGLSFYPDLYFKEDEVGKLCCMSGYGLTGNFNTGAIRSDNKLRAGSNIVDYIDKQLLICSPSRPLDKTRTSLEYMIASGDSGGGLFIDDKLAGINSCIMSVKGSPKSDYRTESGHTRISQHIEWIRKNMRILR